MNRSKPSSWVQYQVNRVPQTKNRFLRVYAAVYMRHEVEGKFSSIFQQVKVEKIDKKPFPWHNSAYYVNQKMSDTIPKSLRLFHKIIM